MSFIDQPDPLDEARSVKRFERFISVALGFVSGLAIFTVLYTIATLIHILQLELMR